MAEYKANHDFTNGLTDWTVNTGGGGTVTVNASDQCVIDRDGSTNNGEILQGFADGESASTTYWCTFSVASVSNTARLVVANGGTVHIFATVVAAGDYTYEVVSTGTNLRVAVKLEDGNNDTVTLDYISISDTEPSSGVSGDGTLSAGQATADGAGVRTSNASGTLSAQDASTTGSAEVLETHTGSGDVAAQQATLSGVAERTVTGTSTLAAQQATLSGAADRGVTGTSTLAAERATLSGTATPTKTGQGDLTAGQAVLTVSVALTRNGTAALQAALAAVSGEGTAVGTEHTGDGTLTAQQATLTASGEAYSTLTGTGDLAAQEAALAADVVVTSTLTGTGALAAGNATLEATGAFYTTAAGALEAGPATVVGVGATAAAPRTAEGELQALSAEIVAQILRTVHGSGTMSANAATADIYPWLELHTQDAEWEEQRADWGKDL